MKKVIIFFLIALIAVLFVKTNISSAGQKDTPPATPNLEDRISALEKKVRVVEEIAPTSSKIEWLEDYGHIINKLGRFDFALGMTGILQGSQNNQKNSLKGNNLNGSGSVDITVTSSFAEYYVATAHLEAGIYNGLDNTFIYPLLFGKVDADDRNPGTNLAVNTAECYLEAKFYNERLSFSAGLLDATVFFDRNSAANDERSQFLNGGFKNNTTVDFPRNYAIGAIVTGKPGIFEFSAGALDAFSSGMNLEDNPFWIVQAAVVPKFGELTHHFRVYGWGNNDQNFGSLKKFNTNRLGYGFGASFDEQILPWLTLFQRAGYARKMVYTAYMSFSGGLKFSGKLYNREFDSFGLAGGAAISNKSQVPKNEYTIEGYYNLGIAKNHVHISPDIQFVINPAGMNGLNNAVFLGARAQVDF